jgi:hypothetical protein
MAYLKNEWWGYQNISGSFQAKRAFYDYELCIQEAILSPFVRRIVYKFPADSREEALAYIKKELSK